VIKRMIFLWNIRNVRTIFCLSSNVADSSVFHLSIAYQKIYATLYHFISFFILRLHVSSFFNVRVLHFRIWIDMIRNWGLTIMGIYIASYYNYILRVHIGELFHALVHMKNLPTIFLRFWTEMSRDKYIIICNSYSHIRIPC
jgi:hypothetical protein